MSVLHSFTVMLAIEGAVTSEDIRQIEKNISIALNHWKQEEGFTDAESDAFVEEIYEVDFTASYPNEG